MSRRVNVVAAANCHMCQKAGENRQVYESHNFRDVKGRVTCVRFLAKVKSNECHKCNEFGHFADRCTGRKVKPVATIRVVSKVAPSIGVTKLGAFSALESSDDEDDIAKVCPNVTVRVKPVVRKFVDWAEYSDDEDDAVGPWTKK